MQFLKNGPDVPDSLLQEHEEGNVVLFCGAGISYPAGLPGFASLVDKLYDATGESPNEIESKAIQDAQFDAAIGLLEGRLRGHRQAVRESIPSILMPSTSPRALRTHNALLALAHTRQGQTRIVTTNFDRLFSLAMARATNSCREFAAPSLPVPKAKWDGVVYLHGVLPETPSDAHLESLVLSSGDFGLAYLTEGWAARFVSELFRNYIVCFVGYSINDPVMRYMVDALAADREQGEPRTRVYAFVPSPVGSEQETGEAWSARNVIPLVYKETPKHNYLHETLRAWAATYRDGIGGKDQIIRRFAPSRPLANGGQDHYVGRVLWALSDMRGLPAQTFARLNPVPSLDWLKVLAEDRFGHDDLSRFRLQPAKDIDHDLTFSLLNRPSSYRLAPWMSVVRHASGADCRWDDVMIHLAEWLTRHVDSQRLILWVAKQRGSLHPAFARRIREALLDGSIRPPMKVLWRLAISGHFALDHTFDLRHWCRSLKSDGLSVSVRRDLYEALSPKIQLRESYRGPADGHDGNIRMRDLVDWEVVLGVRFMHSQLLELNNEPMWLDALPCLLEDFTRLLHEAFALMNELGGADATYDPSYIRVPSILPDNHRRSRSYNDWTVLIDLVVSAWEAVAESRPELARREAEGWMSIQYPVFRRLAFFAGSHKSVIPPELGLSWLAEDDHLFMWSSTTKTESINLILTLADEPGVVGDLEQAILRGPPRHLYRDDISDDEFHAMSEREIWLRLARLAAAGITMGTAASDTLGELRRSHPEWDLSNELEEIASVLVSDRSSAEPTVRTPVDLHELADWLAGDPQGEDDDWRSRCQRDIRSSAAVLVYLARRGNWVTTRWIEALRVWSDDDQARRSWNLVGDCIVSAPIPILRSLGDGLGWWLRGLAGSGDIDRNGPFLSLVTRSLRAFRSDSLPESEQNLCFLAINHPVGHLTEAAMRWWHGGSLEDDSGLPAEIAAILTELLDPRIEIYRYSRVIVALHTVALFRVAPDWTREHLIPLFNWHRARADAAAAWIGYLWSPKLHPPLMTAFENDFLEAAEHYEELEETAHGYADLLAYTGLEAANLLPEKQLSDAVSALPAVGLGQVAQTVVRLCAGISENREHYWRNRTWPFLKSAWPKSGEPPGQEIAESLAEISLTTGESFPDAVHKLRHWLAPLGDASDLVEKLQMSGLCSKFGKAALDLLNVIVTAESAIYPVSVLSDCLTQIEGGDADLTMTESFTRLTEHVRRLL